MDPAGREDTLRAALDAEAALLVEVVLERWLPATDPMGEPLLLPRGDDADPVRLDDIDWADVRRRFHDRHGRPPRSGARELARRALAQRARRPTR
ncbi:MAG: hypothetical protein AB1416_03700 [Actinomycetota bacterium]